MPQVPYKPFPTAQPTAPATPMIGVQTPGAAFGQAFAEALRGFGQTTEKVGDELYSRAHQFMQWEQEAHARNGVTQYAIESDKARNEFESMEGVNAAQAQNQYLQKMADLRNQFREGLPSDYSKKLYDAESQNVMIRNMSMIATHGTRQFKEWSDGSILSNIKLLSHQDESDPDGASSRDQQIDQLWNNYAHNKGWSSEQVEAAKYDNNAERKAKQAEGLARQGRFEEARKLIDNNKGDLGIHYDRVNEVVQQQERSVGSDQIARKNFMGVRGPQTEEEYIDSVSKTYQERHPEDPLGAKVAEATAKTYWAMQKKLDKDKTDKSWQTIDEAIDKHQPYSVQDLLRNGGPNIETAIKDLPVSERQKLQQRINKWHRDQKEVSSDQTINDLEKLRHSNPIEFQGLSLDSDKYQLSSSDRLKYKKYQWQDQARAEADPHVSSAMEHALNDLGFEYRDTEHKEFRSQLRGALSQAMTYQMQQKGGPLTGDETDKLVKRVIRQQATAGWWGTKVFAGSEFAFEHKFEDKDIERATNELKASGLEIPTDQQVRNFLLREQYAKTLAKESK